MCPAQVTIPCEGPAYWSWIQWNPCWFSGTNTTRSRNSPMTNVGIDRPISTPTVESRSNKLRAFVALRMPMPRPTISHRITPPTTTEAVGGRSCLMIVLTDSWVK